MSNLRRYYVTNATIFITAVTNYRIPIFKDPDNIQILFTTFKNVVLLHPYELFAYVVLPDHIHLIIQLIKGQENFSTIMKSIKGNFTVNYKKAHYIQNNLVLWQKRFWDHIIRDENDLQKHLDYIHWNPVKHRYADTPLKWEQSSFPKWIERGVYDSTWGIGGEPEMIQKMDFE
jgi:putative transposase